MDGRDYQSDLSPAEANLYAVLEDKDSFASKLEPTVQEYRSRCGDVIVKSLGSATSTAVEGKLWESHVRINSLFRKQLAYFRDVNGKKKPVEHRKKANQYLKFIKASQRFYRGYIHSLASHPAGVGEIQAVAQKFNIDTSLADNTARDPRLHNAILLSCHRTLIHLGDLSRYRTSELDTKKEKDWGPAIGYYDLAIAIYPPSGISYNQLAIISKVQGDRTRTLYNLYRALSAYEPPPTAFDNLDLELKKIREGKTPQTAKGSDDRLEPSQSANLQRWFPLLHACYFDSDDSVDYEILEKKMLKCLVEGLRERSLKTTAVNRLVLSNIAADFAAGDRWQEAPEASQNERAFKLFQRLNVRTFSAMLQIIQTEYQRHADDSAAQVTGTITTVTRRLLPCIRLYHSWLKSRVAILSVHLSESTMTHAVQAFWTSYAKALSLMVSNTQFQGLPRLEYYLEEDDDVIAFRPFQDTRQPFSASERKARHHGQDVKLYHPNVEMLCRVRDLVEDALELVDNECVPVHFDPEMGRFVVDQGLVGPKSSQGDSSGELPSNAPLADLKDTAARKAPALPLDADSTTDDVMSLAGSVPLSLSTTMNQVVDDLVGPERSNGRSHPSPKHVAPSGTSAQTSAGANDTSYPAGESTIAALTALDFGNQIRSRPSSRRAQEPLQPSIPSNRSSSFVPQPENECVLSGSPKQSSVPHVDLSSTISSMSDPTQASYMANVHPSLRNRASGNRQDQGVVAGEPWPFDSSNILANSSYPGGSAREQSVQPTPLNGQG